MKYLFILLPFISFSQIITDHDKHCYISQELTKGVASCIKFSTNNPYKAVLGGFLTSCLIGVSKEVCDKYKPNKTGFSKKDIASDIWGSLNGSLQFVIYIDICNKKGIRLTN